MDLKKIEQKWQKEWEKNKIFDAEPDKRKKFFVTFPYPYINSSPHVGHGFSVLKCDMISRYKKMNDYNVLFPIGLHATGEPIAGAAKRIKAGDPSQIRAFELCGLSKNEIKKMSDPKNIFEFFKKEWISDLKNLGMSVDWRRTFFTTSLNKSYDRFVSWQYRNLKEKGYVKQASHPIIWCDKCKSPTGSHDRKEGENAIIVEYTILKFKLNNEYLVAATLRPETVFGQTNLWVNPEITYKKAVVDGETWIASEEFFDKLKNQKHDVEIKHDVDPETLIGKQAEAPFIDKKIKILPATFCKSDMGTGIVTCVPSDAPYDYMALQDLKKNKDVLKKYNISLNIEPIPIIQTKEYGDLTAKKICEDLGIQDQNSDKLEKATNIAYKHGFHKGKMNKNCGKYAGKSVREVKDQIKDELLSQKKAIIFYELSEPVVCRCLNKCKVNIIDDQWFLTYSDKKWKKKTLEVLENCGVWPEEARKWLENAIKNMKDKACARQSGLGTCLPWDEKWIIEPLSDSTIYMSFYIVSKYVNKKEIVEEQLTDEFFDYIFLDKGDLKSVSNSTKIDEKTIQKIKKEFEYWYPVDLRNSGKDLLSHHLVFFLFHHAAFFPKKHWPKGISANGWVMLNGEKMSKSKGNFVTLNKVLTDYGADSTRLAFLDSGTGLDDADFRTDAAVQYKNKLEEFLKNIKEMKFVDREEETIDKWILSRIQNHIENATNYIENMENAGAVQSCFWDMYNDINKYLARTQPRKQTMKYTLQVFSKIVSPFAPHFAEELWQMVGKGLLIDQKWPEVDKKLLDKKAEQQEQANQKLIDDIKNILSMLETPGKNLYVYTIPPEKGDFMEIKQLLEERFSLNVTIKSIKEDLYDPENKAKKAKSGKPGIYIE